MQILPDYSLSNPAMVADSYWSSSNSGSATGAWGVYFATGYAGSFAKTTGYYVRCVTNGP